MSLSDEKDKLYNQLLVEYEREFKQFSTRLKRKLYTFIQAGPYTKQEVLAWFSDIGYVDTANGFLTKYDDVIEYTRKVSEAAGIKLVLPQSSNDILDYVKSLEFEKLIDASNAITNTIADASLRYGIGEQKLARVVSDLNKTIDEAGRRIISEAQTGASIYERTIKFEQFRNAGVGLYFYDGPYDSKTRTICEQTLLDPKQTTGWTLDEIAASSTPFRICGGYNCRHDWLPFVDSLNDEIEQMYGKIVGPIQVGEQ